MNICGLPLVLCCDEVLEIEHMIIFMFIYMNGMTATERFYEFPFPLDGLFPCIENRFPFF